MREDGEPFAQMVGVKKILTWHVGILVTQT